MAEQDDSQIFDIASSLVGQAIGAATRFAAQSLMKASSGINDSSRASNTQPQALLYDPFSVVDQIGFKERPTGTTYGMLAEVARRVPVFGAIRQTRINQVASFAEPQENEREPGFQIKLRDKKKHPTRADKKEAEELTDWLQTTGVTRSYEKDSFESFIRRTIWDSLTYDQANFEVVPDRKGRPADFYAVDASTVRMADVPLGDFSADQDPDRVRYVQVYDGVVISEFPAHLLCFGVRNPRTGIRLNAYGCSEIEMMVETITAMLWAQQWNSRAFSQGTAARGILNFKGKLPQVQLEAFRREWYSMISGVANAFRTPVTNADELQWINLSQSNRDMEYGAYLDFLIKVVSAICQFDPSEINFAYGNSGQSSQMFQAPTVSKIKASKDRGLRPILRSLASWINRYLIWPLNDDFHLVFTGLDERSADQLIDQEKKRVSYKMTVDEIRAESDLPPLPDGKGEVILDPTWLQYAQAKEMAAQQEQGMGDEGPEDEGPAGGDGAEPEGEADPDSGGDDEDSFAQFFRSETAHAHITERQGGATRHYTIEI